MREIIFDTETTGFDPKTGDRLVEIGCIELVDRRETGQTFHAYFNPERDMPAAAEAVHGLSIQFLSDKPLFADARRRPDRIPRRCAAGRAQCRLRLRFRQRRAGARGAPRARHGADVLHGADGAQASSRRQAQPRCAVHPLRHRPQPPRQAWRAARRRIAGAALCRNDRRTADRAGAGCVGGRYRRLGADHLPQRRAVTTVRSANPDPIWHRPPIWRAMPNLSQG